MKKTFLLLLLTGTGLAQTIPTTPNLHLPLIPDGYVNWGVPYRQTMTLLDNWSVTVAPIASPTFTGTVTLPSGLSGCLQATAGVVGATGASCAATQVYPGIGIAVSTGTAWGTSLAAPAGTIVGTTDTQTLTNKTVDGVTPTTFGFLDPTSSVQTQLNSKAPLASPALTGTPTAPTATVGTNTTQIATTAFVLANQATYTLPQATTSVLGGVKCDGTTITCTSGVISATGGGGIANVTVTLPTTTLTANTCTGGATVSMPGVTTSSAFSTSFVGDVSGVTGWGAVGGLTWIAWPTADTLNWKVCNVTGGSITPGAATLNVGAK